MNVIETITNAFSWRKRPQFVVSDKYPNTNDYVEADYFADKNWQNIKSIDWDNFSDAIYAFSCEAFCYFLPSILCAGIIENRPDMLVNFTLINMLDMSPETDLWDQYFIDRWGSLTQNECDAVQQWILWISETDLFSDDVCERAYETIELLKKRG